MATLGGARALHISHLTGSLEVGKKADLILVDIETLHNIPRFHRDPNSAYAQIVYAAKAPDVTDVIVNGKILMRNRNLLTLSEDELKERSKNFAKQVDAFLIKREKSILSKLIAIGGALEEESFEVQYKVKVKEVQPIAEALKKSEIFTQYFRHYRQFDTYFLFEDDEDRIRYREDEFIDEKGQVGNVRARLTLIGPARAGEAEKQVMVSRSRYLAPANNSPRFYREYFKPKAEREIEKDRLRYFIRFRGTSFYVNIDTFTKPELGVFLEVKSRTWSKDDADRKARLIMELIEFLGATGGERVDEDFVDMVAKL
jgi:5-methylthioadenosine/S-adenosylhomocysteine deaminase